MAGWVFSRLINRTAPYAARSPNVGFRIFVHSFQHDISSSAASTGLISAQSSNEPIALAATCSARTKSILDIIRIWRANRNNHIHFFIFLPFAFVPSVLAASWSILSDFLCGEVCGIGRNMREDPAAIPGFLCRKRGFWAN
jgi:RsiW-degrading membrane proteinase PrsW (M82 family)